MPTSTNTSGDIDEALRLLRADGGQDIGRMVSEIVPVAETACALARLRAGEGMKYLIDMRTLT